jgi:hypothetical protein
MSELCLTAGLDPAEKKEVWNIKEDNTQEDVVEYTWISWKSVGMFLRGTWLK